MASVDVAVRCGGWAGQAHAWQGTGMKEAHVAASLMLLCAICCRRLGCRSSVLVGWAGVQGALMQLGLGKGQVGLG